MRRFVRAGALAGLCAVAACSGGQPTTTHPAAATARATLAPAATPTRPATPAPPPPRVTVSTVRAPDGSKVTVATFRGPVQYVLHDGSEDPGAAAGRVQAGPAVTGAVGWARDFITALAPAGATPIRLRRGPRPRP